MISPDIFLSQIPPDSIRKVEVPLTDKLSNTAIIHDLSFREGQNSFIETLRQHAKPGTYHSDRNASTLELLQYSMQSGIYLDTMSLQLTDLAKLRNETNIQEFIGSHNTWEQSVIAEFPWRNEGRFVRLLPHKEFREVTFSRNRFVFSDQALEKLRTTLIVCAGMGVGTGIMETLVRLGAERLRFCDGGKVLLKDNNRLPESKVQTVGLSHAVHAARLFAEINPFAQIEYYAQNLAVDSTQHEISLDTLLMGAAIVLEEIDNLSLKPILRRRARDLDQVVYTGTDTALAGSSSKEGPEDQLFHGRMSDSSHEVNPDWEQALAGKDIALKTELAVNYIVGNALVSQHFKNSQDKAQLAGAQYWVQPGIAAKLTAAIVPTAIMLEMEGLTVSKEYMIDLYRDFLR